MEAIGRRDELPLVVTELRGWRPSALLDDPARIEAFWRLQSHRLPPGAVIPTPRATRRLRAAIRELLDAVMEQREPSATALDDVNAAAAGAPTSLRAVRGDGGLTRRTRWHADHPQDVVLAAIADAAIELVTDPGRRSRLRRCANPACSMLFEVTSPRRIRCSASGCGNRVRVSRHYTRRHAT